MVRFVGKDNSLASRHEACDFQAFGLNIRCDFSVHCARPATGPIDVEVVADATLALPRGGPAITLPLMNPDGGRAVHVYPAGREVLVLVESVALFACRFDRIRYRMLRPLPLESLLWQLFGFVFSLCLESRGSRVFHGAALDVGGEAVALLGHSGAGKSSLAAALAKLGCRILGDDHVIVEAHAEGLWASPALPWLKLDPRAARAIGVDPDQMPRLHRSVRKRRFDLPDAWLSMEPLPLKRLVVLDRGGAALPTFRPDLPPAHALSHLLLHSSVPRTAQALGHSRDRLPVLARLAAEVPVCILSYPNNLRLISDVAVAIKAGVVSVPLQ